MESKFVKFDKCDWSGYTLLISSVSVGNVGQLALDLLLSSTTEGAFRKAGYLISPLVQPLVGFDDHFSNLNLTCDRKCIELI